MNDGGPSSPLVERMLIVRLSSMGDVIHALPAAGALRKAYPAAIFGWLVEERWAELLCTLRTPRSGPRSQGRPLVDRLHVVNTKAWRSAVLSDQTWREVLFGLSDLRAMRYSVAVDLQGAARSALLARWSGATVIAGARMPRENIATMWYTRQVLTSGTHVVQQNLSLAGAVVRRPLAAERAMFPCDPAAESDLDERLKAKNIAEFAILNPGAGWGAKRWPAARYGEVAKELGELGLQSVINFGPGEEQLAEEAHRASGGTAQVFLCSLTELMALTRRSKLFVGGDTGPMHLAAALGIPVVALFGPTNPARNGPYGTASIVLRSASSSTSHSRRAQPDEGLLEITPKQVASAAMQLLRRACA